MSASLHFRIVGGNLAAEQSQLGALSYPHRGGVLHHVRWWLKSFFAALAHFLWNGCAAPLPAFRPSMPSPPSSLIASFRDSDAP